MYIETNDSIYDVAINIAQIEITGRCNMGCLHCRGQATRETVQQNLDMPLSAIKKIIDFAKKHSEDDLIEIVLSGGEPLLHPNLDDIMDYCKTKNVCTEITTNGSLVNDLFIEKLQQYNISNISVSIDSTLPQKHDYIRQYNGAYDKAISSIQKMLQNKINTRIRASISKININEMDDLAKLSLDLGVNSLAIGTVIPVGNAVNMTDDIFMTKDEMKDFIDRFFELKYKYSGKLDIVTNECLHGLYYLGKKQQITEESYILNGCTAGVVTFNVLLNGDITPCSMFHKKIANVYLNDDLDKAYKESIIIKQLLDRNYTGKCGVCNYKCECGGCRVRAEYFNKDYLSSDPLCWLDIS